MHVSPAKHSSVRLTRKCDYRTDGQTDGRMDGQTNAGQSDPFVPLCFAGDTIMMSRKVVFFNDFIINFQVKYFQIRTKKKNE